MVVWADEIGETALQRGLPVEAGCRMIGETLGDLIATLGSIDDDEIDWPNVRHARC